MIMTLSFLFGTLGYGLLCGCPAYQVELPHLCRSPYLYFQLKKQIVHSLLEVYARHRYPQ